MNNKKMSRRYGRRFSAPKQVDSPAATTDRSINALLPFGLCPTRCPPKPNQSANISRSLLAQIDKAPLTLITGASGSGKSTLLRSIASQLVDAQRRVLTPGGLPAAESSLPIVDLFGRPLDQTLALLGAVGLAEPKLWAMPAYALSTGEYARLTLARLIDMGDSDTTIMVDEFATPLDRLTARSLCASLKRLSTMAGVPKILVAGAHEDLPWFLDADLLVQASDCSILGSRFEREQIVIERGTLGDYQSLKKFHYIGSDPASPARVDCAYRRCPISGERVLAGVLVIAYPTLNASWRERSWPGRYTTRDKSHNARMINKELRTLARVIVEPRSRGLGIASMLVREYLAKPLTPASEAVAAMGGIAPFFGRGGMTEYPIPHSPGDLRLLDALEHVGLPPRGLLVGRGGLEPLVVREVRAWARGRHLDPDDDGLYGHAAFRLMTSPRAYTHVCAGWEGLS